MNRGNDVTEAMLRQNAQDGDVVDGVQGANVSTQGDVSPAPQQSPATQLTQNPLQHFMVTGQVQVQNVTLASPQQVTAQRPGQPQQLLAHMQGLRVPGATAQAGPFTLSPGAAAVLSQHGLTTQALGRLYATTVTTTVASGGGGGGGGGGMQAAASSIAQRQLSSPAGMMVVPQLTPSTGFQQVVSHPVTMAASAQATTALLLTHSQDTRELQIARSTPTQTATQIQLAATFPATSTVSASGGTIHHHGQSPTRGTIPPLANPVQHQTTSQHNQLMASVNLQQQLTAAAGASPQPHTPTPGTAPGQTTIRRMSASGSLSPAANTQRPGYERTSPLLTYGPLTISNRTSPIQSPDRVRKRIKLEAVDPPTLEIGNKRKVICDEKMRQLREIKENYNEHLTELFFLQNGGNIMDYYTWKKRPTVQLLHFLKSGNLDSDDEEEPVGTETMINDEVKVITTSGGTTPLATPVAISTTLPPAITAMQQQGSSEPGKKLGGRHGMVFGHVQPSPVQQMAPQMPGRGGVPLISSPTTTVSLTPAVSSVTAPSASAVSPPTAPPPPYTGVTTTTPTTPVLTVTKSTTVTTTTSLTSASTTASPAPNLTSQLAKVMAETPTSTPATPPVSKAAMPNTTTTTTPSSTASGGLPSVKSPNRPGLATGSRFATRQHSISAVYDIPIGSQEAIVERAKQEAQVMQRVAELRKEGLWSARRLPKVQEPLRNKAHWDYLLEEMQWLAADFAQERKWKKAGARKIARMIMRYFQEQQQKELRAEKEEANRTKRIASNMAKMVKEFWSNIEKVVQYKQQSRLEEKRKKALDLHLSFIVDQTEKYSSWLTEGLAGPPGSSIASSSLPASPSQSRHPDDGDFEPDRSESDDEETIAKAEKELGMDEVEQKAELDDLERESTMPLDELLRSLPKEILEKPASLEPSEQGSGEDNDTEKHEKDGEFCADESDEDMEDTIAEQEQKERHTNHKQELADLEAESELSMEELYKKYAAAYDEDFEAQLSEASTEFDEEESDLDSDDEEEEEEEEEEESSEEEEAEEAAGDGEEMGMEFLLNAATEQKPGDGVNNVQKDEKGPSKDITDIAATALSLQPTGYTLETTQVITPVPFLLKHTLREYQHVGLDWLATMHDRKLNGILADEMGLGKTIQTIALLAHLACEKEVWGPHLIVVPTSVMLNWEMEFKKWCPAFKILTYYGNQKERKQKRTGWTKTNAFHVCITSYKLVIQDHQAFRRKKWKYFILDEAQNIKNFKSQRWQTLLNFSSQRRLLLTGTPLQNSLMELWSLMHFLMPHVFASHREFKEWFSNPLSGMIEGSREYNENLIKRLHKVLRPFLLRRLKVDVEKQMPKKYEHVVMCRLSKRQRFLYDDFMAQAKTKETLASGHFMSVINILMQLRKVCNHPNLFDPRPILTSFQQEGITYTTASLILRALEKDPLSYLGPADLQPSLAGLELVLPAFAAHRIRKLQTSKPLIEEIDNLPDPPTRPKPLDKPSRLFLSRSQSPLPQVSSGRSSPVAINAQRTSSPSSIIRTTPATTSLASTSPNVNVKATTIQTTSGTVVSRAVPPTGAVAPLQVSVASPVVSTPAAVSTTQLAQLPGHTPTTASIAQAVINAQHGQTALVTQAGSTSGAPNGTSGQQVLTSQPITVQIHHTQQGTRLMIPSGQLSQLPAGFIQIVQTASGQQIIATTQPSPAGQPVQQVTPLARIAQSVANGPVTHAVVTTFSGSLPTTTQLVMSQARPSSATLSLPSSPSTLVAGKPVVRVSPLAQVGTSHASTVSTAASLSHQVQQASPARVTTPTTVSTTSPLTATVKPSVLTRSTTVAATKLKQKSPFFMESLEAKRVKCRREKLERLAWINQCNCEVKPVYGQDLCQAVNIYTDPVRDCDNWRWKGLGLVHCHCVHQSHRTNLVESFWSQTHALCKAVHTPESYLNELRDILNRFVFVVPPVTAPRVQLHTSHPPPSLLNESRMLAHRLHKELSPLTNTLHPMYTDMTIQCPEARLIQYDCGKLQTMDSLLRKLKTGGHRVLIFTQMTKMLDVLEAFLNYHGHRYLRLDGTTRVEQRQALMERFNMDKRIFCFILSTRSGGIGVNLTGADTVIFYDSDWNPTMDAQAQDRCHRIGQTRDVHIYRLISERTVEENILKKANQKRLLGNVAIEGGNFTTAFFKENTLKELFAEPSGLDQLAREKEVQAAAAAAAAAAQADRERETAKAITQEQIEQALCNAEDETDVQAAKVVAAEQKAELAEFDENIPWDEKEEASRREEDEVSKVEQELAMLEKELTSVERYAVNFVEAQMSPFSSEELQKAEEEVVLAKEEWELTRLKAMREEEERRAELEEDEMLFTYSRQEAYNQVKKRAKKPKKIVTSTPKPTKANSSRRSAGGSDGTWSSPESEPKRPSRATSRRSSVNSQASTNSQASSKSSKTNTVNNELKVKVEKVGSKEEGGETPTTLSVTPVTSKGTKKGVAAGGSGKKLGEGRGQPVLQEATPRMTRARHFSGEVLATTPTGMKLRKPLAINILGDGILGTPRLMSPKPKLPHNQLSPKNKSTAPAVVSSCAAQPVVASAALKTTTRTIVSMAKTVATATKAVQPVVTSIQVPQPWSNPNLVIRTRRASAKETRKRLSQDSSEGSEVDIENVTNDATPELKLVGAGATSVVKPVKLAMTSVSTKLMANMKPATSVNLQLKTLSSAQLQLSKPAAQLNASQVTSSNVNSVLNALTSVASAVRTVPSTSVRLPAAAATSILTTAPRNMASSSNITLPTLPTSTSLTNVRPLSTVATSAATVRVVGSPSMAVGANGKPSVLLVSGTSPSVVKTSSVTQASNPNNTVPILEKMAMQLQGFNSQQPANSSAPQSRPQQIIIVQSRPQQMVVQQPGKMVTATSRPQQILVRTQSPGGTSTQRPQQVYIQTRQGGQQVLVPIQTLTTGSGTINLASLQGLQPRSHVTSSHPTTTTIPLQSGSMASGRTITLPLSALQSRAGGLQTLQAIRQAAGGTVQVRQQQAIVQRPQQFIVQQPGKQPQQLILQPTNAAQQLIVHPKPAQHLVVKQAQPSVVAFSPRPTASVKLVSAIPPPASSTPAATNSESLDTG